VACFVLALCPLYAGDMQSVHFDKRGAKITIGYDGDDCGGKKDEVEQAANKICADNTAIASVCLCMCTRVHAAPCVPACACMFTRCPMLREVEGLPVILLHAIMLLHSACRAHVQAY